jgi:hypothetical protein
LVARATNCPDRTDHTDGIPDWTPRQRIAHDWLDGSRHLAKVRIAVVEEAETFFVTRAVDRGWAYRQPGSPPAGAWGIVRRSERQE